MNTVAKHPCSIPQICSTPLISSPGGHAQNTEQGSTFLLPIMKKICALLALSIWFILPVNCQDKHDNIWIFGGRGYSPDVKQGGTVIDFKETPPLMVAKDIGSELSQSIIVMSNTDGFLQFYSNGCEIFNQNYQLMANGDSMNFPGREFDGSCPYRVSYDTHLGIISLPIPGTEDKYVIFHLRHDTVPDRYTHPLYYAQSMLYSIIDMSAENGAGRVTKKNVLLQKDSFCDMLAAVRHGNGRDWWVAVPQLNSDTTSLFLLTPYGIQGPFERITPLKWSANPQHYQVGGALFSQDGTRYARVNTEHGVHLFNFDRCSGEFSCPVALSLTEELVTATGLSFSPNGRFLYASTSMKLFQFDCSAKNIQGSKKLIDEYDGFKNHFATTFYQHRLAPDGKIYMSCTNGAQYLHVINHPDAEGKNCDFKQRGIDLPTYNGFCLPNYPNYRLYDWAFSPCDSLGVDTPGDKLTRYFSDDMQVLPNPASEQVTIIAPDCVWGSLRVFTAAGALVEEIPHITNGDYGVFDVRHWPSGVYFVSALTRGHGVKGKRLVVLR